MKDQSWRTDRRKTSERGYGWEWQKARKVFLQANPLCMMCRRQKPARITAANTVDHRVPHRGDQRLFWDRQNWQSLCSACHNGEKQAAERSGRSIRIGLDGFPVEDEEGPQEAAETDPP